MVLSTLLLFLLFLLLIAFFSASETAFIASSPYTLDYLEKKGSKRAALVKKMQARIDHLLAAILIGNTLVNVAAASVSTLLFISVIPDKHTAVILSALTTTLLILFFAEINPKTYAAHNPLKVAFWLIQPLRFFVFIFYPLVKLFTLLSSWIFPSSKSKSSGFSPPLNEEETKALLTGGVKGMSSLRRRMISEILDIGKRPIKEIMVPRPQVKAIEAGSSSQQILNAILSEKYSRFPVYKARLDNIEGVVFARDVIPYLIDNKPINIYALLHKPFFVPESASLEKVLLQMQENRIHLAFIVDEFGNMEGIVTLEDILEEIVGDLEDGYEGREEGWFSRIEENIYVIKGAASIKEINRTLNFNLPEKGEYTTLAGFFLYEFGRIPHEQDVLTFEDAQFIVEKMNKRHISLIRTIVKPKKGGHADEDRSHK